MNAEMDWSDLQLLERIAHAGTLSGAARLLGVNQTTVARRLAALERRLGAALFDRIAGRMSPTPVLASVLDRLRTMTEEADLSLALLRHASAELQGSVRVTSVGTLLSCALAPALHELLREARGLRVEFVADDQLLSFERREADIALRLGRTGEDWARLKVLGAIRLRLCRPVGAQPDGSGGYPLVRYGNELSHVPEMAALDRARPEARVALMSSRLDILMAAALAIGAELMLPEPVALADPRFAFVPGEGVTAERPLCLLIHPDRIRTPSVAKVARWIERTMRPWCVGEERSDR
jgi:DNA-binding transcriptional LysR family regulator